MRTALDKHAAPSLRNVIAHNSSPWLESIRDELFIAIYSGGIAHAYKSTLGSNITFKTNFDFTHTSFEVVQASITVQHNKLHFFCLYRPPPNQRNSFTDSMSTEQLPDLPDYVCNLPGFFCLVVDMNIHLNNPLQSQTKQTVTTLCLYNLVYVINKPTHRCVQIIDWDIVRPDDDIHI